MATNDHILVSTSEMEATIQKFENARSILQDAFKSLQAAKDHLDNCYKGPAYVALCVKWTNIYLNITTAERAVDKSVNGLRKTISGMDTAESGNSSNFGSLESGKSAPTYL